MTGVPVIDIDALLALNPGLRDALWKGEEWAIKHITHCESLNRGEPEGFRRPFDGNPQRWCGTSCPFEDGCVVCTLPEDHEFARNMREYREAQKPVELARKGVIYIAGDIDERMAAHVREMLEHVHVARVATLELRIESHGGEISAGMRICDMIASASVKNRVGRVDRYAFSMAAIILQACDRREVARSAQILLHHTRFREVTLPMLKSPACIQTMVDRAQLDEDRIVEMLARRTKRARWEIELVNDRDTKMSGAEALAFGLVDVLYD